MTPSRVHRPHHEHFLVRRRHDRCCLDCRLSHGLLTASFVPPPPVRELRDLTRYRKALINEKTAQVNRIHKVLQDAGIKLTTYATDVMGVSGRAMMRALIAGQSDSAALAELAKGRMRTKIPDAM